MRRRFGIETSYRQLNQAKAVTSTTDPRRRLLWLGVALLLRQVWVWLTAQLGADRGMRPTQWVGDLRLARLGEWLADLLKHKYKEEKAIPLGSPLLPLAA